MSRTHHHSLKWGSRSAWKIPFNYGQTPGWWVRLFMNRPKRFQDIHTLKRIVDGSIDPDAAIFHLGNRKPHKYYW